MSKIKNCKFCQSEIPKKARVCPVCKRTLKGSPTLGIFIIIFSLFFAIAAFSSDSNSGTDETKNDKYITLEEFNQIEIGMSYEEVVSIVGSEGSSSSTATVGDITTTIYIWYGKDGISNANVTFSNDSVMAKAQFELK